MRIAIGTEGTNETEGTEAIVGHFDLTIQYDPMTSVYLREIIFGFEDSFVSTLGTITGVAAGSGSSDIVILSGSVLIVVEAVSMAAGSYLSSKTEEEVEQTHAHHRENHLREHPIVAGGVMFLSYLFGGIFPLLP